LGEKLREREREREENWREREMEIRKKKKHVGFCFKKKNDITSIVRRLD